MKIFSVSGYNLYANNNIKSRKSDFKTDSIGFKRNYEQTMRAVLERDIKSRQELNKAMTDLFLSLTKETEVVKTPFYESLAPRFSTLAIHLVEDLCKPIAKVSSELRDIVFKTQEQYVTVLEKGEDSSLYIMNFGKHGFWNTIFERESARNDIKIVFASKDGTFEVGTNKKGNLVSEQCWQTGYWKKNEYATWGDRISEKTGDASEPVILPGF